MYSLLEGGSVSLRHLPDAGDARLDAQNDGLLPVHVRDLAFKIRAGPDQAHVADEHAPNLGQLVQAILAQHAPHARDARIDGELVKFLVLRSKLRIAIENFFQTM